MDLANVVDLRPGFLVAFQAVTKAGSLRSGEIEAGVVNLDALLARRHFHRLAPINAQGVSILGFAFDKHRLDDDGWRVGVRAQAGEVERCQSFDRWKPEPAIVGATGSGLATRGAFTSRQAIGCAIGADGNEDGQAGGKIVEVLLFCAHQAAVGADPEVALAVLNQVANAVADEAFSS